MAVEIRMSVLEMVISEFRLSHRRIWASMFEGKVRGHVVVALMTMGVGGRGW